ncbi:mechanosensitive ion channel family protein [Candidatus Woesearchaeota archaeon]|jgi:small-conductance mechanosensitive channel|nr:mechanosensitive ion channel family protein [Candidatus Woesearchaeota archaeon]
MVNNTSAIGKGINTLDLLLSGIFTKIVVAIIILLIGFIIGKILGRLLQKVLHEFETDKALKKSAGIHFSIEHLFGALLSYFIYFIAIIMALNQVGLTSAILNMLSGAVILLILISMILAIKDFVPNMVAGIFIFQKGIIKEGDIISFDKIKAKVVETTLIETKLESKSKDIIYIPNSALMKKEIKKLKR